MLDWLRKFLAPPVFAEEDKQRTALLLNTLLLILLFLVIFALPIFLVTSESGQSGFIVTVTLVLFGGILA